VRTAPWPHSHPPPSAPRPAPPPTPLLELVPVARNAGCAARRGGPTGVGPRCPKQARVGTPRPPPNSRLPALPTHHHKQTWHQMTHAGRGKGRSAVPAGQGRRAWVHCSPRRDHRRSPRELRRPAINALCAAPSSPIKSSVPETGEVPEQNAQFASDKKFGMGKPFQEGKQNASGRWLKQATQHKTLGSKNLATDLGKASLTCCLTAVGWWGPG